MRMRQGSIRNRSEKMSSECTHTQCRYNVNGRCAIQYYQNRSDVPSYCPNVILKEDEE